MERAQRTNILVFGFFETHLIAGLCVNVCKGNLPHVNDNLVRSTVGKRIGKPMIFLNGFQVTFDKLMVWRIFESR